MSTPEAACSSSALRRWELPRTPDPIDVLPTLILIVRRRIVRKPRRSRSGAPLSSTCRPRRGPPAATRGTRSVAGGAWPPERARPDLRRWYREGRAQSEFRQLGSAGDGRRGSDLRVDSSLRGDCRVGTALVCLTPRRGSRPCVAASAASASSRRRTPKGRLLYCEGRK